MVVKYIGAWILIVVIGFDVLNGYQWYCSKLTLYENIFQTLFSICTIIYTLNYLIIVGILKNLTKYSFKMILLIGLSLIMLKIGFTMNLNELSLSSLVYVVLSYFGKFLGIFLGLMYFKSIKLGLLYLVLIWIAINIINPFINWGNVLS